MEVLTFGKTPIIFKFQHCSWNNGDHLPWFAMDFLDFFDDAATTDIGAVADTDVGVVADIGAHAIVPVTKSTRRQNLLELAGPNRSVKKRKKTFYFSRGTSKDRKAWNLDMQLKRSIARRLKAESDILGLLTSLKTKSQSGAVKIRRTKKGALFSRSGLVRMAHLKVKSKGNRFESKWSLEDFLVASFGDDVSKGRRVQGLRSMALSLKMSPTTVSYMRCVTFGAIMARQSNLLARIFLMRRSNPPLAVGIREAFDETSQQVVVKEQPGSWEIMVVKHTLLIVWNAPEGCEASILKVPIVSNLHTQGSVWCFNVIKSH